MEVRGTQDPKWRRALSRALALRDLPANSKPVASLVTVDHGPIFFFFCFFFKSFVKD